MLRVSEVVNLRTNFIDNKRMVILIKEAKGKKDGVVSLSPVILVMLRYKKPGSIHSLRHSFATHLIAAYTSVVILIGASYITYYLLNILRHVC